MATDQNESGPVTIGELHDVVASLRLLAVRASEAGQQTFHFVLSIAADSLDDNIEMALEIDSDAG